MWGCVQQAPSRHLLLMWGWVQQAPSRHLIHNVILTLQTFSRHLLLMWGLDRFSETIHFAAQSRTVFLSNHINWGPQGRGWEFERNFELAHSSFWLLKFIVSQVQKLEYPSIFAGLLLLNKKRQNFALGAILKSTKKSFFSSWISSKLVKWHPSYKSPKLREVWENLKYYSNNPLYFVSLSLLNKKR